MFTFYLLLVILNVTNGRGYVPEFPIKNNKNNTSKNPKKKQKPRTNLPVLNLGGGADWYYFETNLKLNYFEAFEFCRKNNMNLLSIESKKEEVLIKTHLFNLVPKVTSVWTSGTDLGREGHYIWLSTGQEFSYTNWHPTAVIEPNNYNNSEHCIHMYQYYNAVDTFFWNDHDCKLTYNFVCEIELNCKLCI
ncbi:hypothetical protein WA026_021642 [Henosepilachna vigintioctopunctata]|uniref:C-type lectin domain-containing protein n=1 Tax=Henosepilachna vigintioctopunctata TaxID=420089 RepID=A0AAW1UDZ5_9CUCU